MPTIEEIPDDGGNPATNPRFQLSEDLKRDAKGSVKTVVEGLNLAASMTRNVPYLGIVSGALAAFMKIQDEVDMLRSDWKAVMDIARQMQANLDYVRERVKGRGDDALPKDLVEPLAQLEKCLANAVKTINACKADSKSFTDRARLYLDRSSLSGDVKQCREAMKAALDFFNTRVNVINMFALDKLVDKHTTSTSATAFITSSAKFPPHRPGIFHGRAREVDHIVDQILHKAPARIAILGSGGIGKTSIALTVLHHPDVVKVFGDHRYFVSCEAATTAEGVVLELLATFGVVRKPESQIIPQQLLQLHLKELPGCVLCLDNLETPWDADTRDVEDLLGLLASFPKVVLLITTRGSHRPKQVIWTQPFLEPIVPLTLNAALLSWDAVCGVHDDYSVKLVQAVDCVPLAVILLANLAQTEASEDLWKLWEHRNLAILPDHVSHDRLSNIEFSIGLSLQGPRLKNNISALRVLQIICMLPQGLLESRTSVFADAYTDLLPDFQSSIILLKRCALAYSSNDGFLRILSPIRHYIQTHYTLWDQVMFPLADIYCVLVNHDVPGYGAMDFPYARDIIHPEIENISTILMHCLTCRLDQYQTKILSAIISFSDLCQTMSIYNIILLSHAADLAMNDHPQMHIELLQSMGMCYFYTDEFPRAISTFTQAIDVCDSFGNSWDKAWNLKLLGQAFYYHGEFGKAKDCLQLASSIYEEQFDSPSDLLDCKVYLSRIYTSLGQLKDAGDIFQSIYQGVMDSDSDRYIMKANCAQNGGELYLAKYEFASAEQELLLSLELSHAYAGILGKAITLSTLGHLYTEWGDYNRAEHILQASKELFKEIGSKSYLLVCLNRLGQLHIRLGQLETAENYLQDAIQLQHTLDMPHNRFFILSNRGDLLYLQGQYDEARSVLKSAIEMTSAMPYPFGQGEALFCLGKVHRECDELQEALLCFREAIKQFQRAEDPRKAESVGKELAELVAMLRATGGYISPAITEGNVESASSGSFDDEHDEDWHSAVGSEPESSERGIDDTEATQED